MIQRRHFVLAATLFSVFPRLSRARRLPRFLRALGIVTGIIPASKLFRKNQIDEALKRGLRRDAARIRQGGIVSSDIEFLSIDGLQNTPSNRLFVGEGENEELGLLLLGTNSRGALTSIHLDPLEADSLILMVDSIKKRLYSFRGPG